MSRCPHIFCSAFLCTCENSLVCSTSIFRSGFLPLLLPAFSSPRLRIPDQQGADSYISFHRIFYFYFTPQFTPLRPKCPWIRGFSFFYELLMAFSEKPDSTQNEMHSCRPIYFPFVLRSQLTSLRAEGTILVLT